MRLISNEKTRIDPESLRLPLIALIDVVLFLLFYFVISTSIAAEDRELTAALATQGPGHSMPTPVYVEWNGDHPVFALGSRTFADRQALTDILRQVSPSQGVIIHTVPNAPVEATATAIQAARDAGIASVSYAVTPDRSAAEHRAPPESSDR